VVAIRCLNRYRELQRARGARGDALTSRTNATRITRHREEKEFHPGGKEMSNEEILGHE
jgi:hypothetical protein